MACSARFGSTRFPDGHPRQNRVHHADCDVCPEVVAVGLGPSLAIRFHRSVNNANLPAGLPRNPEHPWLPPRRAPQDRKPRDTAPQDWGQKTPCHHSTPYPAGVPARPVSREIHMRSLQTLRKKAPSQHSTHRYPGRVVVAYHGRG